MKLSIWFVCSIFPIFSQGDDLIAKSHRAKEEMAAGNFSHAVILYRELVRALPDEPGLRMNLGLAQHSAAQYREAIPNFEAVLRSRAGDFSALLFLGLAHAKLGEAAAAIGPLEQAVGAEPSNKIALLELGSAYLDSGHASKATTIFVRLTTLDPESAKGWHGLGLSHVALARQAFSRLESRAPESAYWYALAAQSKFNQQRYGSAFYLYRRALEAEPRGLTGVHAGLAEIYCRTGHPDWAKIEKSREVSNREAKVVAPSSPGREDYEQAVKSTQQALEAFFHLSQLSPTAELHGLLANAERIQEHYAQAQEEYREALRLDPTNRQFSGNLAQTLWLAHDFESAAPILQRLLREDPNSAEWNFELGDIWLEKNAATKSLPFLNAALQANPGSLGAHASIAKAYLQLGRAEEAIPHFRAALPGDADGSLRYQLARAYKEAGQAAAAERTMAEFRKLYRIRQEMRDQVPRAAEIVHP